MSTTLTEAARLMWCSGIGQHKGHSESSVHSWVQTANYAPVSKSKTIQLTGIDNISFLNSLCSDINRLSSAASETLSNIQEVTQIPKSLAWPYVKLYYAALFYTHTILRVWGKSPTYFRTLELMPLKSSLDVYGVDPPFKIKTGQYLITATLSSSELSLTPEADGGSHESVWREFHKSLKELQQKIIEANILKSDKDRLTKELKSFISLISANGSNDSWPSQMRNNIQYRQEEGVWYPYKGKMKTSLLSSEIKLVVQNDQFIGPNAFVAGNDIANFKSACFSIISFSRSILNDIKNVGGPDSFLRFGQHRFETAILATRNQ